MDFKINHNSLMTILQYQKTVWFDYFLGCNILFVVLKLEDTYKMDFDHRTYHWNNISIHVYVKTFLLCDHEDWYGSKFECLNQHGWCTTQISNLKEYRLTSTFYIAPYSTLISLLRNCFQYVNIAVLYALYNFQLSCAYNV